MLKEYCEVCKDHHFNNFVCSMCGVKYSGVCPIFSHGSASSEDFGKRYRFCPMCGHEFVWPARDKETEE